MKALSSFFDTFDKFITYKPMPCWSLENKNHYNKHPNRPQIDYDDKHIVHCMVYNRLYTPCSPGTPHVAEALRSSRYLRIRA